MIPPLQSLRNREPTPPLWADEVQLPGGLYAAERLERVAYLRPITGLLERTLGDIVASSRALPDKVSALLAASVERIGSVRCDERAAAALCVADRRYLMIALAGRVAGDDVWLTPACVACQAPFDVRVSLAELPVKPANDRFPFVELEILGLPVRLRLATGADQAQIGHLSAELARLELLRGCIVSIAEGGPPADFVARLSPEQIDVIDAALDEASPDVGTLLDAHCPECGERQVVALDPYHADFLPFEGLDEEVHALACTYHWSEGDILNLPRQRRRRYLRLIERERGVYS